MQIKHYAVIGTAVAAAILSLFVVFGSFYTVDQGEEAVLLSFGKVTGTETAGLHIKMPFVQSAVMISTQTHFEDFKDMESYSQDQQPGIIQMSILYHVPAGAAGQVYAGYGSLDALVYRIVQQKGQAVFKNVFGTYNAQNAIGSRAKLNADVLTAMQAAVEGEPIAIESIQVKDIKFDPTYEAAIQAKQKATVEVATKEQELAKQKIQNTITVSVAQADADSQLAVATNQAEAVRLQGVAQASAIQAKGVAEANVIKAKADALNSNPSLIELTKAEAWDGKLPTTVLPNGTLPFIDAAPAH